MKVKLKAEQYYIGVEGGIHFGKKDEVVDIDSLFIKHIKGKYEIVNEVKQAPEKPLAQMNKKELVEKCATMGIEFSDDDIEGLTKAQLIEIINEKAPK